MTAMPKLTDREFHIAWLVMRGLDNRAIAARAHLSRQSVRSYVHRLVRKIGAHSRTMLAIRMRRWCGLD